MSYLKKPITLSVLAEMSADTQTRLIKCDFCAGRNPVVIYIAERMSTGEMRSCWRWAACSLCSQAVDKDDWSTVEARLRTQVQLMMRADYGPGQLSPGIITHAVRRALNEFHTYATRINSEENA